MIDTEYRNQADARAYRRRQLNSMSKSALIAMYSEGVPTPTGGHCCSLLERSELARWSKNDLMTSLLDITNPV
jgi:hypothetical protein